MIAWCRKCNTTPMTISWRTIRRPKCGYCLEYEEERKRMHESITESIRRARERRT